MYIGVRESPMPRRTPMIQLLTTMKMNPDENHARKA